MDFVLMSYVKVFDNDSPWMLLLKLLSYPELGLIRDNVGDNHLGPLGGKALCRCQSDALCCSSDQNSFVH
jgi:hypothetical protein